MSSEQNNEIIKAKKNAEKLDRGQNIYAPGEARTHGLQIMRLMRCLLRYGGTVSATQGIGRPVKKFALPTGGLEPPIFGLGDRRLIH